MTITYSNPQRQAVIENWPSGRHRVTATFTIEGTPGRERAVRVTTGAPHKLTYSVAQRIVTGSNGHTYILCLQGAYISVMQGNMKYQQETVWPTDARFEALKALFDQQVA